MPEIERERFYTGQWDDDWGYVLDNPGSVPDEVQLARYPARTPNCAVSGAGFQEPSRMGCWPHQARM
jgi:hypothetical protein